MTKTFGLWQPCQLQVDFSNSKIKEALAERTVQSLS
jgi:hypothetical protein